MISMSPRTTDAVSGPNLIRPFELVPDEVDWTGRWPGESIWRVLNAARDGDEDR